MNPLHLATSYTSFSVISASTDCFPVSPLYSSSTKEERLRTLASQVFGSAEIKSHLMGYIGVGSSAGSLATLSQEWKTVALAYPPFGLLHLIANVDHYLPTHEKQAVQLLESLKGPKEEEKLQQFQEELVLHLRKIDDPFQKLEKIWKWASVSRLQGLHASSLLFRNPSLFHLAVQKKGEWLHYADESLKQDRDFLTRAICQNPEVGDLITNPTLRNELEKRAEALQHAEDEGEILDSFQADKMIVLAAVKQGGRALYYADDSLKADREIVLTAVKQNGGMLQYANASLKADREVVLTAVKQYGSALADAHDSLKADREIVLEAGQQ
jgi:hypothetical protein